MTEDVIMEEQEFQKAKRKKVAKPLLWISMISIVMLFAGLTSAVIVRKGDGNWLNFDLPIAFTWSTVVIALSSVSMFLAIKFGKKNNFSVVKIMTTTTLLLGILFIQLQFVGYDQLVKSKVYFTGAEHNASGAFLYIISALHIAHLVGGIIALLVVVFNAFKERYDSKNLLGLQLCSTYWHFMGAMWIYLFFFFNLII
ncbi:MAG: cytochrome oxidase subunit III [Verrucomicrobia bacterium]|nr:cytochrome oxidase subunit III [Verrucomicrobiota bacterium]